MRVHEQPLFDDPAQAFGPPLTQALWDAAQRTLGVRLPAAFRATLDASNGGRLRRDSLPHTDRRPTRVWSLRGVGYPEGLAANPRLQREWGYPAGTVVISGEGPRAIVLDYRACGPTGSPSVGLADSDQDVGGDAWVGPLRPNFASFIGDLRHVPGRTRLAIAQHLDPEDLLGRLRSMGGEGPANADFEGGHTLALPGRASAESGTARLRMWPNRRPDGTHHYAELADHPWLVETTLSAPVVQAFLDDADRLLPDPLLVHRLL